MYFGFPASSSRTVQLEGDRAIISQLVRDAFAKAGWRIELDDDGKFAARIPMGMCSYGERLTVSINQDGAVEVRSVCAWPMQIFDWGKNEQNIDRLFENLTDAVRNRPLGLDSLPAAFDEDGSTPLERALRDKSE